MTTRPRQVYFYAMLTAAKIIADMGGIQPVAKLLQTTPQAVWNMKDRNVIPPRHWLPLARGAAMNENTQHITLDALEQMSLERPTAEKDTSGSVQAAQ